MIAAGRVVFGLLVAATFAAFFVTQRLKHAPTVVQRVMMTRYFSPTGPRGHRAEHISFRIKRPDDLTVTVVNQRGEDVSTLARSYRLPAYTQLSLSWDGRTDRGSRATMGTYRIRVRLRDQGRSVLLARSFVLGSAPAPGSAP